MPDANPPPKETRERLCPHCLSPEVGPLGHVSADRTGIRSEYRCRDCSMDFVLLSAKRPAGLWHE
jgi:DNA-directed RNA polymerase subunit RPC12/RpoP